MATVSSDQRLKIFDLNDEGTWVISSSFKAHDSSINRVIWGPPEHGQIVATCSYDRAVRIWEEQEMGTFPFRRAVRSDAGGRGKRREGERRKKEKKLTRRRTKR